MSKRVRSTIDLEDIIYNRIRYDILDVPSSLKQYLTTVASDSVEVDFDISKLGDVRVWQVFERDIRTSTPINLIEINSDFNQAPRVLAQIGTIELDLNTLEIIITLDDPNKPEILQLMGDFRDVEYSNYTK